MNTKEKIIEIATELIKTRGYAWSYEDISAEVGIKKASIHYHFPSKDDLIYTAIQTYVSHSKKYVEDVFNSDTTFEEKFIEVASVYKSNFYGDKNKLCLCLKLSQDLSSLPEKSQKELHDFHLFIRDAFVKAIKDGIEAGEFDSSVNSVIFSNMFFSTCQGMHLLGCYYLDEDEFLKTVNYMIKILKK